MFKKRNILRTINIVVVLAFFFSPLTTIAASEGTIIAKNKKTEKSNTLKIQKRDDQNNFINSLVRETKKANIATVKMKEDTEKKEREERENQEKLFKSSTKYLGVSLQSKIKSPSGLSHKDLEAKTYGTGLNGLEDYYLEAEKNYGINAGFLLGISALESGWGNSHMANSQNNLFGWGNASYSTKEECILDVGKKLSEDYGTPGGKYFTDGSVSGVQKIYCPPNNAWGNLVVATWKNL